MHMTDFAPVLSATSSRDCIWIMFFPNFSRHARGPRRSVLGPSNRIHALEHAASRVGGAEIATEPQEPRTEISAKLSIMQQKQQTCQSLTAPAPSKGASI